jgi:UDP-3-O-[3-hydroxymyristoyl] glucosamine N-acyltransferase
MEREGNTPMEIQIKELLSSLNEQYHVHGNIDGFIRNACPIDQANEDSICFCKEKSDRAIDIIRNSKARIIVCYDTLKFPEGEDFGKTLIQVTNPRLTFSRLLSVLFYHKPAPTIHATAIINEKAVVGRNVHIGPNSYIGNCKIGEGTIIDGHVYIHDGTSIGKGVIIHAGVVVGTEAVAFERNERGELEWFPQLSGVIIEDDVEIGANSVICRGSLSDTSIGKGTKLDVSVTITHGVRIGKNCIVAAGTVICGSSKIGDHTWIGPLACIREGIKVGNHVLVGAGSVVHKDIPDNVTVTGSPARPIPIAAKSKT